MNLIVHFCAWRWLPYNVGIIRILVHCVHMALLRILWHTTNAFFFFFCFFSLLIRHRIFKLSAPSSEADECIHDFTFLWPDHRGRYKSWPRIFTDYV
jgi:hypothetical protein